MFPGRLLRRLEATYTAASQKVGFPFSVFVDPGSRSRLGAATSGVERMPREAGRLRRRRSVGVKRP